MANIFEVLDDISVKNEAKFMQFCFTFVGASLCTKLFFWQNYDLVDTVRVLFVGW